MTVILFDAEAVGTGTSSADVFQRALILGTTLRLECEGIPALLVNPDSGFRRATLDLGNPDIRATVADHPDGDGTDDNTEHLGARAVSLEAMIVPPDGQSRQDIVDRLGEFLAPHLRPWLYFALDSGVGERRIRLRSDSWSAPITRPQSRSLRVAWRGPDGIIEDAAEDVIVVSPSTGASSGRTYPMTTPRTYPAGAVAGVVKATILGRYRAWPIVRMYGPSTDPVADNVTLGRKVEFSANGGVTVPAGQYLEVNMAERTARMNGDPADSRVDKIDWTTSDWWWLERSTTQLRYDPDDFDPPAVMEVRYRPAYVIA